LFVRATHNHAECPGIAALLFLHPREDGRRLAYAALQEAASAGGACTCTSQLAPDVVATIRAAGVEVHAHSVIDEPPLELAFALGLPWICTDVPERALAFRHERADRR
jgi:glycerophosphoryl diester phosphodiesterase